jgi:hypothetical protein
MALLSIVAVSMLSGTAFAQSDSNPTWDFFIGYQWTHPGGTVPAPNGDYNNPTPFVVPDMSKQAGFSLAYNFDKHWAGEADLGINFAGSGLGLYENTWALGPRFMWRTDDGNYFLHALVDLNRVNVSSLGGNDGVGLILGGGMDLPIRKWLAWRVFDADYDWAQHNYSAYAAPEFSNLRRPEFEGVRLRTGLVFSFGGAPPIAPTANVTVQPAEVLVGEPITATATTNYFNPKHPLTYAWSSNGGQVTGKDTTAQIDTTNMAPGSYTVTVRATDPREKKNNEATATATFTVKPLPPKNPPTMSISASPTTLPPGGAVSLSANCTSPDGVSVTVATWTASAGTVTGSGTSATLDTTGTAPGSITVGATCTDSRGLSSQASAQVMIETPPPPPPNPEVVRLEARLALHSIYFPTAIPPVSKPNTGLLPSQKKTLIALATDFKEYLQSKPDAHLILGGHADIRGSEEYNQKLSERRVNITKSFLVAQGVPEGSIDTKAYGKERNLSDAEVKDAVENNPELTPEERARVLKNITTIRLASNRRVDVTLSTTGQTSVRQYPFNSTDALTLIGGREGEMKKKPMAKKGTKKRTAKP